MRNPLKYFFILLVISSCSSKTVDPIGFYEVDNPHKIIQGVKFLTSNLGYSLGSSVLLKQDSTFEYNTCGSHSKGSWTIIGDSLLLKVEMEQLSSDTLNVKNYDGGYVKGFEIDDNYLISELVSSKSTPIKMLNGWITLNMKGIIIRVKKVEE